MKELHVQKYLRSGKTLADLENDFGIIVRNYEDSLVILNYSQIDSPKSHEIVMECRGLILETGTWNIVCYPFKRFFNYEEVVEITENFDYANATCLEKLDGSLISVFYYNNRWYMSTRGAIENESQVGFSNITFRELFYSIIDAKYPNFWKNINKDVTYCFELTAPENRVVTVYDERSLTLLMAREACGREIVISILETIAEQLGVGTPNKYDVSGKNNVVDLANSLKAMQEGFVAVDYSCYDEDGGCFRRVKIKNPSYVAMHHLKNSAGNSMRSLLRLVMSNEQEEFINYFPEFKVYIDTIKEKYDEYLADAELEFGKYQSHFDMERNKETKKSFALAIKDSKFKHYLFYCYNKKVLLMSDFLAELGRQKSNKSVEKDLLKKLRLKDISFEKE